MFIPEKSIIECTPIYADEKGQLMQRIGECCLVLAIDELVSGEYLRMAYVDSRLLTPKITERIILNPFSPLVAKLLIMDSGSKPLKEGKVIAVRNENEKPNIFISEPIIRIETKRTLYSDGQHICHTECDYTPPFVIIQTNK